MADVHVTVENPTIIVKVGAGETATTVVQPEVLHVASSEAAINVLTSSPELLHVQMGMQGPPGRNGLPGINGGVFALDAQPAGAGIVGGKQYADGTVPAARVLTEATSDSATVRVYVGCNGGAENYSPAITVAGVPAILTETATKRWFEGYADVPLTVGENIIAIESDDGAITSVIINRVGAGPAVAAIVFGTYPGAQTSLKSGDLIDCTITTDLDAVTVTVQAGGAAGGSVTMPVVGGIAHGIIAIGSAIGMQGVTAIARNGFGTDGDAFASAASLLLDQTYPSIGAITIGYDNGLQALGLAETGTLACTIGNADSVIYTSPDVLIADGNSYAPSKIIANNRTGYVGTGTNLTITANRAANNATTTAGTLVRIATIAPTASISIAGNPARLTSSPTGLDYEVRITPSQLVSTAPTLTASHGAWQGVWQNMGTYWRRSLRIADSTPRGAATFSGLSITGPSGITGNTITGGAAYTVGGFSQRTVTFPAFSRVAPLGVSVGNEAKTAAQIAGGAVLARHSDTGIYANGYYIANSDGSYNPTGDYLGLSDSVFAGSNTTGTLQAIVSEVA